MSIQSADSLIREYRRKIKAAIVALSTETEVCGIGALTPEQVERNLSAIRRLEADANNIRFLTGCSSFDEYVRAKS